MSFGTPPPLIAAAQILYAITTESQGYNLTKVYVASSSSRFICAYTITMSRKIAGFLRLRFRTF